VKPTLSCPSPSGSCSSFFSSSAQSTGSLFPDPSLPRRDRLAASGDDGESTSCTETVGLSAVGVSMLAWLLRRPKALRISLEFGRDESLRSSTMICGRSVDSLTSSSSGDVPASDSGTVTIESVGSGELSTCILGERVTASSTFGVVPSFWESMLSIPFVMTSCGGTCARYRSAKAIVSGCQLGDVARKSKLALGRKHKRRWCWRSFGSVGFELSTGVRDWSASTLDSL
jgi:hypothetical protein